VATEPVGIQPVFHFGEDYELNLRAYELRRAGQAVKLEPTPFEILVLLVEQRGNLVGRQQIAERIWGKGVFLDTDNSINGAIRKIRQVLADDPENPRFIQTVTGRGYRFVAPVVECEEPPGLHILEPPQSQPASNVSTGVFRTKFKGILLLGLFIAIALGLALWLVPVLSRSKGAAAPIRSIAVLPLENLSGDSSQDYFADAMTDELITDLAKVGTLRVTSRTTVTLYKHTYRTLPQIARELNVDGIVEGSVVRSGQRVRITAQLIRAAADQHLWAETYDRDLGDALRLQSDVAADIAQQVRAKLSSGQQQRFRSARAVDPEAYDAYLKGSYYLYNSQITVPGPLSLAKANFEKAVRKDPNFSDAYSGLANAYLYLVFFGQGQISAAEGYSKAKEDVSKALELDPENAEAYDVLGVLKWHADLDWSGADQAFNQSLALAPSYSCALEDRALFLASMGRSAEALAEVERSKQVDPAATGLELGVYFQLRDWSHLVKAGLRESSANPTEWTVHSSLATGLEGTGKLPEAIAEYQKAVDLSNGNFDAVASLGHAYAVIGNRVAAEKILRRLEQASKMGQASPYLAATIYAGLGNKDKAFELLEQSYRDKSLDLAWTLKPDLRMDSLRADRRFQDLLSRTGLSN
jgi:TolB-like protein/DNA-binding winged helix-turn-helix (wHTH) protein/Flp pilus assembly protein TadD